MVPRKGAQVAKISKEDLQDVLEVRKALDTLSVKLACERITEDEIKLLNNAEREFEKALASKDVREIAEADVAFHDVIHSATKNGRLKSMISNLAERIYRYRFEYIKQQSDGGQALMLEHREIMRCIEGRDVESAVKATEIHIDNQEISISEQLDIL